MAQPPALCRGLRVLPGAPLGLIFGSIPTRSPGDVQMPSTLLRLGLLFISGVFVPLAEIGTVARVLAYLSPLTYAQDLMNHAVLDSGLLNPWLDVMVLLLGCAVFLVPSLLMHRRSRQLGYRCIGLQSRCATFLTDIGARSLYTWE